MLIHKINTNDVYFAQKKRNKTKIGQGAFARQNGLYPKMPVEQDVASFLNYFKNGATEKDLHKFITAIENTDKKQGGSRNTLNFLVDIKGGKQEGKTFIKALQNNLPANIILRLIGMTNRMYASCNQPDYVNNMLKDSSIKQSLQKAGILENALRTVIRLKR